MSREAMQKARDALNYLSGYLQSDADATKSFQKYCQPALEALRVELAKPEQEPVALCTSAAIPMGNAA